MAKDLETNPSVLKKKHLGRVLRCSRCKPHRGENATFTKRGVQKARHKNKRRRA